MAPTTADHGPDDLPGLPEEVEDKLYEILLDRPAEQRPELLEQLVNEHPDSRAAVMARVEAMTAGDDVLGRASVPLIESPLPDRIGGYEITGLLGEGGFGTVYRAEQHEPVHRVVALKVLHAGRVGERSQWRFQAERQTLARMQHPGIAQIYEAGSTAQGLHYFAMEFVAGEPITRWCDRRRLSVAERLALFLRVCAAVHHAHQRGVVHRDLKPGNVLVTTDGEQAQPKVIDFGVAKLLEIEDGSSLATRDGALIGTPGYMSPEQAAGEPVDTRTDVYALGVLLYELLTGDLPFPRKRLTTSGVAEIARMVRKEEPRRLGAALRDSDDELDRVAAARGCSASNLLRELRSDLDWIVRRALAKHPDQRYPSVSDLIADVERYQRLEPVSAREPEALYLVRRFVSRHRFGVAVSALLVAGGAALVLFLAWSLGQVDDARRIAVERSEMAVRSEYAAQLAAARAAILSGDAASARRHLEACAEPLRGWEWHYLSGLCDTSDATVRNGSDEKLAGVIWLGRDRLVGVRYDGVVLECDLEAKEFGRELVRIGQDVTRFCLDDSRERLFAVTGHYRVVVEVDTRSWERRILFEAPPDERRLSDIRALGLAPDQRTLAISQNNGAITLLDTLGAEPPRELCVAGGWAWSLSFSKDGKLLAIGGGNGDLELRALADGETKGRYPVAREGVNATMITPDGTAIIAAGGNHLHKLDIASGRLLQRVDVGCRIWQFCASADRRTLYSVGSPKIGQVLAHSIATLEPLGRYHGHRSVVNWIDAEPGTGRIATTSGESIRVWPATPPQPVTRLEAGFFAPDLGVSPDGDAFATANWHGLVRVWNARTLELELELQHDPREVRFLGCALSPTTVYVAGTRTFAIDRVSGEVRAGEQPEVIATRLCLDPMERWLVGGSYPWGRLLAWRLPGLELVHDLDLPVADRIIWDDTRSSFLVSGRDESLRWFDPDSGTFQTEEHAGIANAAIASRNGALACGANRLLLRSPGDRAFRAIGPGAAIASLAFAPDLSRIAIGSADATTALWSVDGTELLVLDDAPMPVYEIAFVAGGRYLIGLSQVQGNESYVMVWGPGRF